jgi:hypothetical protein
VCVVVETLLRLILHDFVGIVVVEVRNLCGPMVGLGLDRRSFRRFPNVVGTGSGKSEVA